MLTLPIVDQVLLDQRILLGRGDKNPGVTAWQRLLMQCGAGAFLAPAEDDGDFGGGTHNATNVLRDKLGIPRHPDNVVDAELVGRAVAYARSLDFPLPPFLSMPLHKRADEYGRFDWSDDDNDGWIAVERQWAHRNITRIKVPEMEGVVGYNVEHGFECHRDAAPAIIGFFHKLAEQGLMGRVLTFGGCWAPRRIRTLQGWSANLSDHSWGIALDINPAWNGLGKTPAAEGEIGSIIELLPTAYAFGFYNGGGYKRQDAMHFTLARPERAAFMLGQV